MSKNLIPQDYQTTLAEITATIRQNKRQVVSSVNQLWLKTCWQIGRLIEEKKQTQGWGSKVIDQLSKDLTMQFPHDKGYSKRNLENMARFYTAYPEITQTVSAQLSFSHYMMLISHTKLSEERDFYTDQAVKHHWSVRELEHQIDTSLFERVFLSKSSIEQKKDYLGTLKSKNPDPAAHFRDEYVLGFIQAEDIENEAAIEQAILTHLEAFFLEWGRGSIALVGRQFPCDIDNNTHRIDLLFYHRELDCLVALDLKKGAFKAEYAGQMAKYLGYLNAKQRFEGEQSPIGIILCEEAGEEEVQFTFSQVATDRMKVATYTNKLPDKKLLQEQVQKIRER